MKIPLYKCKDCFSHKGVDNDAFIVFCRYKGTIPIIIDDNGWKYVECPKLAIMKCQKKKRK